MNIYIYRLQQLATGLRRHDEYNWRFDIRSFTNGCGTAGCAVGLCQHLFPETFEMNPAGSVFKRGTPPTLLESFDLAMEFFGLDWNQTYALFGSSANPSNITASQVADKIDALIAPHIVAPPVMFKNPGNASTVDKEKGAPSRSGEASK